VTTGLYKTRTPISQLLVSVKHLPGKKRDTAGGQSSDHELQVSKTETVRQKTIT
jgi:hypothetical protein